MSSPPPIVPLEPYFEVASKLSSIVGAVYEILGQKIKDRKYIYNRATFYSDLSDVIRFLVDELIEPFASSPRSWRWWADQLDLRSAQLGADPAYTMVLPPPRDDDPFQQYQRITNQIDKVLSLVLSTYEQEEYDLSQSGEQGITGAECAKLCHRLAYYALPTYCYSIEYPTPSHPGQRVTWSWLRAAADEFYKVYRQLGESSVAGGWGPGGGEIPPISWPG